MKAASRIALLGVDEMVETVWVEALGGDRYRLANIPFFAYGVSMGDVVEARWRPEDLDERDEDDEDSEPYGFPYFVGVLERAGHATLRLAADHSIDDEAVEVLRATLCALGCRVEGLPPRLLAIDVPPTQALDDVQALLAASGLAWENGDPPTDAVPGRVSYRLRQRKGAAPSDDERDDLLGVARVRVGDCDRCSATRFLVVRMHAHRDRLRLRAHGGVTLSVCGGCGSTHVELCERLTSIVGASALTHERQSELNPWAHELPRVRPGPYADKLGGYPHWARAESTPRCVACDRGMWLVAQLGPDTLTPLLGRKVVGYLFVCPDEHAGTFVEQPI